MQLIIILIYCPRLLKLLQTYLDSQSYLRGKVKCKTQSKIPAPTGTTAFHLALMSFAILRFIPLSTFRLWFPWRGCWHFIVGLNLTPSSARCFGHIVKSRPSEASNKPTEHGSEYAPSQTQRSFVILWRLSDALLCYLRINSGVQAAPVLAKKYRIRFHRGLLMNTITEP